MLTWLDETSVPMTEQSDLPVEVYRGDRVTAVGVSVNGQLYVGESKRAPGDAWDVRCGYEIALARALHLAGDELARKHQASLA